MIYDYLKSQQTTQDPFIRSEVLRSLSKIILCLSRLSRAYRLRWLGDGFEFENIILGGKGNGAGGPKEGIFEIDSFLVRRHAIIIIIIIIFFCSTLNRSSVCPTERKST
jgi:hypothetical protein